MEHYCTLFDSGFLPQGLSLYLSLRRHARDFTLWILCMDDAAETALVNLALPEVRCVTLKEIETSELLAVKKQRTRGEYCWTLSSFLIGFVLKSDSGIKRATYIDADCWFINDPRRLLCEMDAAGKDVLITPHAYLKKYDQSKISGIYCVQFVPFRRTPAGMRVLEWWQEKCLDWCYAKPEPGRFGDQKYLDVWPQIFADAVHVLQNADLTIAPWNADRYRKTGDIAAIGCMYHCHQLKLFGMRVELSSNYRIPPVIIRHIYRPYLDDLRNGLQMLEQKKIQFTPRKYPYEGLCGLFRKIRNKSIEVAV